MLEVLLALGLLSLLLISLLEYQLSLMKAAESLNFKVIAMQQVLNFSEEISLLQPAENQQNLFKAWEAENSVYLPNANSNFEKKGHICTLQLQWHFLGAEAQESVVYCK